MYHLNLQNDLFLLFQAFMKERGITQVHGAPQSAAIDSIPNTLFKVQVLSWSTRDDTENIVSMELHLIPNVCSEYPEQ